jgi:hypothetical protein
MIPPMGNRDDDHLDLHADVATLAIRLESLLDIRRAHPGLVGRVRG